MATNPYDILYGQEYNPNGDQANGQAGANTPGSVQNAAVQGAGAGAKGDPFAGMLAHAQALNAVRAQRRVRQAPPRGNAFQPQSDRRVRQAPDPRMIGRVEPEAPSGYASSTLQSQPPQPPPQPFRPVYQAASYSAPQEMMTTDPEGSGYNPYLQYGGTPETEMPVEDPNLALPTRTPTGGIVPNIDPGWWDKQYAQQPTPETPVVPPPVAPPPVVPPPVAPNPTPPPTETPENPVVENPNIPLPPREPGGGIVPNIPGEPPPATTPPPVTTQRPAPPGVNADTWTKVNSWVDDARAQGADYSWLYDRSWALEQYYEDMARLGADADGVDFVDWAKHRFTDLTPEQNKLAGRRGYDTYLYNADGSLRGHGNNPTAPEPPAPGAPATGTGTPEQPVATPPVTTPPVIIPSKGVVPKTIPGTTPETGGPEPAPPGSKGTTPTTGGPEPAPPGSKGGEGGEDWFTKLKAKIDKGGEEGELETSKQYDYEQRLSAMFRRQQDKLERKMRSSAALDGRQNSGGFGMALGNAQAELSSQQGAQMADQLVKTGEAGLDRSLQKYTTDRATRTRMIELSTEAGMNKYITDLNNDLEKNKIKTNDDLQRYLNSQDNVLKKYGIDKDDLLERYKAELGLEGAKANAASQVSAARLSAAAQKAASDASRAAQKYDADTRLRLGLYGTDVDRENNLMRNQNDREKLKQEILRLIMENSPDPNNTRPPTGTVVVRP